jgi:PAS domain S-box-containing protein
MVLAHSMNALRFEYSAMYFEEPGNTQYQAWLEGLEEKPDIWTTESNKEYTNLHEGDYIFHVKARNVHGVESNESTFYFSVEPPWYRTLYAYFGYLLLFIFVLFGGIRLYVRKLKADRDRLERIVKERTSEIQQQKEEISVQAEELERINQELQKLSLVASKTDNAVIIAGPNGSVEWINDGFVRLFGYSLGEIQERLDGKIDKLGNNKEWKEMFEKVNQTKKYAVKESEITTKSGEILNIQTTLTPILDYENNVNRYIAISTDITQLKEVQRELQKLIATKDKFFSIIAHDLKNPFHSLMGISELLTKYHNAYNREKLKELYGQLYNVTHKGYQLLTNLLEWSRSQTGNLKFLPEKVDISELVDKSMDLIITTAESKNVKVENTIKSGLIVLADKNTITTVIRNLVSNAIKYSEEGGKVTILGEERDDSVVISVQDNGVGISPENMDKLFRIDVNYSTKGTYDESGTGLGLILCKEFVEKNGGKMFAESILGEGSTFSFTLKKP